MEDTPLLFDRSIQKLDVLFKLSGMNLKNEIKTPLDTIKHRWLFTLNFLCVASATGACIYYIITGASQGVDFTELMCVAPCVAFTILAIIKSLFYLIYEAEVVDLINGLRELEIKENKREQSFEKEEIIKKDRNFLNTVINVLYILNCSMLIVFDLPPLVIIAVKYVRTNEFDMMLPFLDVFLFIPHEFKYWLLAYVHQIWSECVALLEMGAADYLFFTCCTYIRMHFRLLQHDFERIISEEFTLEVTADLEFQAKIKELVKWHQDLIESSTRLEVVYSKSNLFNFLSSSLVICLTGFNVTVVDDYVVVVTFIIFLFMGLMQIFFLCFFADMLTKASSEVSDAIYNSRWYCASQGVGKDLLLVQTRAQKPCKLTALGFVDVNLMAFMRVLSTSWSYFALLQSMYGEK